MARHTCHAERCTTPCPPRYLMCARHWRMVPPELQDAVYEHYQTGQERGDTLPSNLWFDAADRAIAAVAAQEHIPYTRKSALTDEIITSGVET